MTFVPYLMKKGVGVLKHVIASKRAKPRSTSAGKATPNPRPSRPQIDLLLSRRAHIHQQIGQAARQGRVPDGMVHELYDNHCIELTEDMNELDELGHHHDAIRRRLDARFPAPVPAPPPETPPKPRHYPRLRELFGSSERPTLH